MNILGIHAAGHDTGACLIAGKKICCISEERLSGKKHDGRFPDASIRYVFNDAGLSDLNDVELIVVDCIDNAAKQSIEEIKKRGYRGAVAPVRHHDAHAASAFFASPFKDAAVLVADGYGSWGKDASPGETPHYLHTLQDAMIEVQSLYRGTENGITLLRRTVTTDKYGMGIGTFYELATLYLGFGRLEAGKVMGLSAYGNGNGKAPFKKGIFTDFCGDLLIETGNKKFDAPEHRGYFGKKFFAGIPPRTSDEPLKKGHAAIASFVQAQTEDSMLALAKYLSAMTQSPNLCLAGGVALNCLANRVILDESGFKTVYIQPASSDTGIPLGCALYGYHVLRKMPGRFFMKNAFLGRQYSKNEISRALKNCNGIRFSCPDDALKRAGEYLAKGKIIGWFEGKSELGPRALGHRSILADPRDPKMKEKLNRHVKRRELFRPYAPSVLEENADEYFDLPVKSPFMLLSARVKEEKKSVIPAVTHVDGTARVQTVNKMENKKFYGLIHAFYSMTGVPVLLNTSFNVNGMAIVETPEDALDCFLNTKMDILILENFLVEKEQ